MAKYRWRLSLWRLKADFLSPASVAVWQISSYSLTHFLLRVFSFRRPPSPNLMVEGRGTGPMQPPPPLLSNSFVLFPLSLPPWLTRSPTACCSSYYASRAYAFVAGAGQPRKVSVVTTSVSSVVHTLLQPRPPSSSRHHSFPPRDASC